MGKERGPVLNGLWLEEAIQAQGHSLSSASKLAGIDSRVLYAHKAGKITISTGVLYSLCLVMPTLSERYILTGRGPKSLPSDIATSTSEKILVESLHIRQSIDRILAVLTS